MSTVKKQIIVNVYKPDGTFITTWVNVSFDGFSKEINGGVGECVLGLSVPFDYGEYDLLEGNDVEIRVSDRDTMAATTPGDPAKVIYRGYISLIERDISERGESVKVHLLGHYTELGTDILKNAAQTTLYSDSALGLTTVVGDQDAADVGKMMRTVLDRYIAETTNPKISYDSADIPDTGTVAEYSFEQATYREAMDKLKSMSPAGYFYYINEEGMVKFGPQPTTPTHKFIFKKHFNQVHIEKSMEKVRNFFVIWNGETGGAEVYKHYQDDDSISQYRRRAYPASDYGVDNVDAADLIGAKFIAENKDPEVKVTCTIIDNNGQSIEGYDIETINPGDTCSFYGFESGLSEIFRDNMLITKVVYYLDKVEIEVQVVKSGLVDFQEQQGKEINSIQTGGLQIPESYA